MGTHRKYLPYSKPLPTRLGLQRNHNKECCLKKTRQNSSSQLTRVEIGNCTTNIESSTAQSYCPCMWSERDPPGVSAGVSSFSASSSSSPSRASLSSPCNSSTSAHTEHSQLRVMPCHSHPANCTDKMLGFGIEMQMEFFPLHTFTDPLGSGVCGETISYCFLFSWFI